MHLKRLELNGFKSFAKKSEFIFDVPIIAIVGPNGSGKSNVVEAIRFVLGEQSVKSMRGKTGSDLIFKGSKDISKMSRASVNIVFDNTDRVFFLHHHNNLKINVDFDEITITREVFADGGNRYLINGHEVRMKDIHELIASVNIGASGHHIISQGEADRYLNANIKDRRELIEEALGLKVYQYRLKESQRKLEKSEMNLRESEMLRRELAPHLKFLKRQVDKIEKAKELRTELVLLYRNYFAREDFLIQKISNNLEIDEKSLTTRLSEILSFLDSNPVNESVKIYEESYAIDEKKIAIQLLQEEISNDTREIGKLEGMISLLEKQEKESRRQSESVETDDAKHSGFSYDQVKQFFSQLVKSLDTLSTQNLELVVLEIKSELNNFVRVENTQTIRKIINNSHEITSLLEQKTILVEKVSSASSHVASINEEILELQKTLSLKEHQERESQKQYYEYIALKKELDVKNQMLSERKESLMKRQLDRNEEYAEAIILVGEKAIVDIKTLEHEDSIDSVTQENSRRELERIKIRLEDMGGGSGIEVVREFEETQERDQFLEKEIIDITETISSLQLLIFDLKQSLNTEFNAGVKKINIQFDRFFKLMFGGGEARLQSSLIKKRQKKSETEEEGEISLDEDDSIQEKEYGIDIDVQLPRKKVSDLDMLSGGERSLTSIALLFALSQVNPPPFLVLDETDAALDEANSQKYGDMIGSLSKFSQLIVVTHNRETMSRAQTLFGVTLGRDDSSTMLSLRLEDATQYAK